MKKLINFSFVILSLIHIPILANELSHKEENMVITTKETRQIIEGPADYFTGKVWIDPFHLEAQQPSNITSASVTFEPGARTNWHTHPVGQLLIVTSGKGWTQCEGGLKIEVNAGDTIWCPPNHKHWHGATSSTSMSHIAIQEMLNGTNVIWMEPVSEDDYLSNESSD